MILLTKNNPIMKKIYFLLAMLILTVSSAWADVKTDFASIITPIGSESAEITNSSRSKTMDDGVILSFSLPAGHGNLFAQNVSNPTWNNSAAVDELNSVLGKSLNASDYFPTNTGNHNGQGGRTITCTANLSNATDYDATKVVTFYVTLFSSGNGTPSITVSGFSSAYYSYAKADGNGFVDVSSLSEIPAGNYFTVVKVKGKLSAGSASVQYTMPNCKTGAQWMAVVYNEDIPSVENTYRYVLGEQEIANYTHEDIVGSAPTGAMSLPTYVTLETTDAPETCTGTASTFTYQVSYNETLPFQLGTPYSLTIRDDATPQYNIYVDPADETKVKSIQNTDEKWTTPTLDNFNYFNWVMGGDFYNGFTFQNVATGKYLTYGENVSPADNTISTIIDEPNAGAKFILSVKYNRNCFKIKGTTNNTFINKRADDLSTWASSNADGETGSAITFCEPIEVYSTTVDLNLTDDAGNVFSATVSGKAGKVPHLTGAEGYTLSEEVWDGSTLTAKITFPFPTSSDQVKNPTCIQSALGESKWRANSSGYLKANNKANTNPGYSNQDRWNWYIYPSLSEDGVFSFQIYNVGAEKYIPTITTTNLNTETALSDEPGSYQFRQVRTDQAGFYQESTGKFLTINTSGTNQNIWLWTAGGGHMGSTMSFPDAIVITLEEMQAKLAALANTTKFELVEGATVISPSEYAAPSEINAAIDAANQVDSNDGIAIENFLSSDDANKIKQFNNASTSHGAPLTTNYVAKAGYNTIILPVNWSVPSNWTKYSCEAVDGNVLTLTAAAVTGDSKNTPYIVLADKDETFQFIGYSNGADTENVKTAGILAGANFATTAPAGSYILTNGSDRFEKVYEDTEVTANQCWIVLESNAAALLFEAQPTPAKATANMRITDAGWGTFYAPFAVAIPEGVKAYTGTLITESETPWIRMDELTEGVIPANTGVVVAKEVEGEAYSEDLEEIETTVATASTCYTGNAYNYNVVVEEGAYLLQKNYVAEKQENVVGWYKVQGKGFTLAPNRCYLSKNAVPAPNQSRPFIGFEPVDDATGINSIATEAKTKADGKYMVKGQIVVVKAGKAYNMNGTEIK